MIVDRIENVHLYADVSGDVAKALEILKDKSLAEKENGRYDVEADELYYIVQRYQSRTIEESKFEAHKKYIDIQFVAQGREILGYSPLGNLETEQGYSEENDCALYRVPSDYTAVNLKQGMFCVLWPSDGHMPGCQLNGPIDVVKVVVKVRING